MKAAQERNIAVAEVTRNNVTSVLEYVLIQILALVRNCIPAYKQETMVNVILTIADGRIVINVVVY